MWKMITDLLASGVTVFLTTQYLEEADRLADKIAVMDGGKIIAEGTAEELKQQVGKERLELAFAQFQEFEKARRVLGGQVLNHDEQKHPQRSDRRQPQAYQDILDQMEQAAVEVDSLSLRKPTLDDVFLTLIGRQDSLEVNGGKGVSQGGKSDG
jgi:ABC-2 type transport system ATP-binding protein